MIRFNIFFFTLLLAASTNADATFVRPTLGGDQETPITGAAMKHAMIGFDGNNISVHLSTETPTPTLRELKTPNEFDPAKQWNVLIDKAYNAQHGWFIDGTWAPPVGLGVWIEELNSSPELEVYQGGMYMSPTMIDMQTFNPIFGTDGSPDIWQWNGMMTHNAYAVLNPTQGSYSATYRVYLGDMTGVADPLYGSDTVTFNFIGVPEPNAFLLCLVAICSSSLASRR